MVASNAILQIDLPFAEKIGSGKVRDIYQLGDDLLLVTSDRVSAFDVVMDQGIPGKGVVLTQVSAFWFDRLRSIIDNHMLSTDVDAWDDVPDSYKSVLRGRTMRCKRARPLPVEWVVRGYLTGSGYQDYQDSGEVSGVLLQQGLQHASQIEPAILTPSTKSPEGHDVPISFDRVKSLVGTEIATQAREAALELYQAGLAHTTQRGIVLADTKFEFGILDDQLMLIDECLTPDSSRFWPAAEVQPGSQPTSYDKQVLRNYLSSTDWNKQPPPPTLPDEVLERTAAVYLEIQQRLTQ